MIAFFTEIAVDKHLDPLRVLCLLALIIGVSPASAATADVPVLTPEQLESYQFPAAEEDEEKVTDLTVGQRSIMNSQRRLVKDLIARRLGILSLKQDESDLTIIQTVIDRNLIRETEVREWQALGVVFGDVLAKKYGLHWVSFEDSLGASRALRYKDTQNFVFPVTMFSKRVYFKEDIVVSDIVSEIGETVDSFKRFESLKPS